MDDAYYDDAAATFGDRLAAARERAGMAQRDLAARLGVKLSTLKGWEEDRSEPRANRLQMLAGMLNVSMVWLMTGAGEGVAAPSVEAPEAEIAAILGELRETRMAQARLADRLGRLERRLQAVASRS
jgi:transcriptional regulator with XRE-family HTH domain